MKAAQINQYGGPSVIEVNEIDKPKAADGQVLVEVHSSSLNPFDTSLRSGSMKDMIPVQFPITLGGDLAGVVTAVGNGVTGFAVGDKVYGQAYAISGNSGTFAEFATAAAAQIAKIPDSLNFDQAASLPLVGVSAWQAVTQHIKLAAGQKLFIHGGAGGIGTIAIQIAKHIGASVTTTATGEAIDYVKNLGADRVIDYKAEDFAATLSGYDAVFDTVGGDDFNKALGILKSGGIAVTMIAQPDEAKAGELGVTVLRQGTKVTTAALEHLNELVESGVVKPQVSKTFPLDEIVKAFEVKETGKMTGKIIIKIK